MALPTPARLRCSLPARTVATPWISASCTAPLRQLAGTPAGCQPARAGGSTPRMGSPARRARSRGSEAGRACRGRQAGCLLIVVAGLLQLTQPAATARLRLLPRSARTRGTAALTRQAVRPQSGGSCGSSWGRHDAPVPGIRASQAQMSVQRLGGPPRQHRHVRRLHRVPAATGAGPGQPGPALPAGLHAARCAVTVRLPPAPARLQASPCPPAWPPARAGARGPPVS